MSGLIFANADCASSRTERNRRQKDIEFLAKLRAASEAELDRMNWDFRDAPDEPEWKRIAIVCAIKRVARGTAE